MTPDKSKPVAKAQTKKKKHKHYFRPGDMGRNENGKPLPYVKDKLK